jgi:hypothetical protein
LKYFSNKEKAVTILFILIILICITLLFINMAIYLSADNMMCDMCSDSFSYNSNDAYHIKHFDACKQCYYRSSGAPA